MELRSDAQSAACGRKDKPGDGLKGGSFLRTAAGNGPGTQFRHTDYGIMPKGRACRQAAGQAETREKMVRKDIGRRLNRGGRKRLGSPPSSSQPVHRQIARKGTLSKGSHPRASPIATATGPNGTAARRDAKERLAGRRHEDVSYSVSNRIWSDWISTFSRDTVSSADRAIAFQAIGRRFNPGTDYEKRKTDPVMGEKSVNAVPFDEGTRRAGGRKLTALVRSQEAESLSGDELA